MVLNSCCCKPELLFSSISSSCYLSSSPSSSSASSSMSEIDSGKFFYKDCDFPWLVSNNLKTYLPNRAWKTITLSPTDLWKISLTHQIITLICPTNSWQMAPIFPSNQIAPWILSGSSNRATCVVTVDGQKKITVLLPTPITYSKWECKNENNRKSK